MLGGLRVRPRPLNIEEKLPVIRLDEDDTAEYARDPAFQAWLIASCPTPRPSQPPASSKAPPGKKGRADKRKGGAEQQLPGIAIPPVRCIPDWADNEAALRQSQARGQAAGQRDPGTSGLAGASAYIRHNDHAVQEAEPEQGAAAQYDMDEEDAAWLAKLNKQVSPRGVRRGGSRTISGVDGDDKGGYAAAAAAARPLLQLQSPVQPTILHVQLHDGMMAAIVHVQKSCPNGPCPC